MTVTTWCFLAAAALLAVCLLAIVALDIRRDRPDGRHRPEHAWGTRTQVLCDDTMPIDLADIPEVVW